MSIYLGGPKHYQPIDINIDADYREWYSEKLDLKFALFKDNVIPDYTLLTTFLTTTLFESRDTANQLALRYYRSLRHYTSADNWFFVRPFNAISKIDLVQSTAKDHQPIAEYLFKERESILRIALRNMQYNFPNTFFVFDPANKSTRSITHRIRPLAKNTYFELRKAIQPKTVEEEELLVICMSYYCRSTSYLLSVAHGRRRIDLQGKFHEEPAKTERQFAAAILKNRNIAVDITVNS